MSSREGLKDPSLAYINVRGVNNTLHVAVANVADAAHIWKFRSIGNLFPLQAVRSFRCER